jgi:crotonobetainyl-CoA:carnitine CoA-transferase CaiB-like acyl-CoA transferase
MTFRMERRAWRAEPAERNTIFTDACCLITNVGRHSIGERAPVTLPLDGIRVIEVGQALAGPLAGVLLADMGADVIKIEKPDGGDDARLWGPPFAADGVTSLYFHSQNRNKRSVVLDLKLAADVEALNRLCESADILIQNLRPGVVDEIGIGPEAMLKRHPRLIYCSIWAFGYQGPMRMKPGFDPLLQAYGAMMSVTGRPEDPPTFCGASINDKATGMFCTIGALAALRMRDKTGQGCLVDTSLFDSAVHWVEGQLNGYLANGVPPRRHGTGGAVIVPYQLFETADHPVCLAAGNDRLWARCAQVLGHPEWASDPRFAAGSQRVANKAELLPLIAAAMRTQNRAHWLAAFEKAGVPCSPVNDIAELAATEQLAASEMVHQLPARPGEEPGPRVIGLPITFDRTRPRSGRPSPNLGEHTAEVLGRTGK